MVNHNYVHVCNDPLEKLEIRFLLLTLSNNKPQSPLQNSLACPFFIYLTHYPLIPLFLLDFLFVY